jgi:hypothetical protein
VVLLRSQRELRERRRDDRAEEVVALLQKLPELRLRNRENTGTSATEHGRAEVWRCGTYARAAVPKREETYRHIVRVCGIYLLRRLCGSALRGVRAVGKHHRLANLGSCTQRHAPRVRTQCGDSMAIQSPARENAPSASAAASAPASTLLNMGAERGSGPAHSLTQCSAACSWGMSSEYCSANTRRQSLRQLHPRAVTTVTPLRAHTQTTARDQRTVKGQVQQRHAIKGQVQRRTSPRIQSATRYTSVASMSPNLSTSLDSTPSRSSGNISTISLRGEKQQHMRTGVNATVTAVRTGGAQT